MRLFYRTMIIKIIRNFEIWQISLLPNETFSAFGNRVEAYEHAEEHTIRDQRVTGANNETVPKNYMLKNWNLP